MTTTGDPPGDRPATDSESGAVHVQVNGTTVMAEYEVVDGTLLLASADFGDASAELGGLRPDVMAARLLWEKAEAAMARVGDRFMRDGEVNVPETPRCMGGTRCVLQFSECSLW